MSKTYEQLEPVIMALDDRISAKAEQINALDTRVTAIDGDVYDLSEDINEITIQPKNLFDTNFEIGSIGYSTGKDVDSTTFIRTKGYIKVESNTKYIMYNGRDKLRGTSINPCQSVFEYDSNKTFLRYSGTK